MASEGMIAARLLDSAERDVREQGGELVSRQIRALARAVASELAEMDERLAALEAARAERERALAALGLRGGGGL